MTRSRQGAVLSMLVVALLLAGCGASSGAAPAATPTLVAAQPPALQAVVASSDLAVGRNRFTFGIIDKNRPLKGGHPRVSFFALHGSNGTLMSTAVASFNQFARGLKDTDSNSAAIELGGVYVTYVNFPTAGDWGVEIRFRHNGRPQDLRQQFKVAVHSRTPAVGSPAPRSNNPTTAQEPATKLDSGRPPDDMHRLSIAQAIAQHKPLVVLFATAAFCTSRLCGPEIEVVKGLEARYRGRVNFVHIEIYRDAQYSRGFAPTVLQWHLLTEPWVFMVNRKGIITAKFDGPTPASEIAPAINADLHA